MQRGFRLLRSSVAQPRLLTRTNVLNARACSGKPEAASSTPKQGGGAIKYLLGGIAGAAAAYYVADLQSSNNALKLTGSGGVRQQLKASFTSSTRKSKGDPSYTPVGDIPEMIETTRSSFLNGSTSSYAFRLEQLKQLRKMITDNEDAWIEAGKKDMYKRSTKFMREEETEYSVMEIDILINNLEAYMKPQTVGYEKTMGHGKLHYVPMGNTLIIGPWNFPLNLCVLPLAGAIAAGCTAILKPSEVSPEIGKLLEKLIPKYLDDSCYKVVLGAVKETTVLLQNKFDMIFFTGAPAIGKIVATAAAKQLTPCVLELGGKNPVVVDDTVDMDKVAEHLVNGRFGLNCGQNCTSPQYVIINRKSQDKLIEAMRKAIPKILGENPMNCPDYCGIVNDRHWQRLYKVLEQSKKENRVVIGGDFNAKELYIEPAVVRDCDDDCYIMNQETFGPILSIYPVDDVHKDAIPTIQSYPKALIMFVFSNDKEFISELTYRTDAGAITVNSVTDHFVFPGFPFGGVGNSGQGRYHGKYSFLAFSHEKPVLTAKL